MFIKFVNRLRFMAIILFIVTLSATGEEKYSSQKQCVCSIIEDQNSSSSPNKGLKLRPMIISGHHDYPIFMWRRGDTIIGIGPELARLICSELNLQYEIKYLGPWKRVQECARAGCVDLIVGIYKNKERQEYLDYSVPYMPDLTSIAVRKDDPFKFSGKEDLIGLNGITMYGDSFGDELDSYIKDKLNLLRVHNADAIFINLLHHNVDYILWGDYPVIINASKLGVLDNIKLLKPAIVKQNMYMAFSKKSPYKKYLPQINIIINRLRKDGTIKKLEEKYLRIYKEQYGLK